MYYCKCHFTRINMTKNFYEYVWIDIKLILIYKIESGNLGKIPFLVFKWIPGFGDLVGERILHPGKVKPWHPKIDPTTS